MGENKKKKSEKWEIFLELTVFICGAVVMILEMVGSRILGPYVGTSIYTWTSLIGIILGAMSLGYWWGGKQADKQADINGLAVIILGSGVAIGTIYLIKDAVLELMTAVKIEPGLMAILASVILFFIPSMLLGMVSPYAVKIKLKDIKSSGRTMGNLSALSTMGSIVGTFLAGYYLIPTFGSKLILIVLATVMVLLSAVLEIKRLYKKQIMVLVMILVLPLVIKGNNYRQLVADVDTEYSRVWIFNTKLEDDGKEIRALSTDLRGIQSAKYLDNEELVLNYTKYYRLGDVFNKKIKSALMIGGAAYSYPKDFLAKHSDASLEVVEIDPKMTALARQFFDLKDNPKLVIVHQDGRVYLNRNQKKFGAIYIDAFNSLTIPYQLTTKESAEKIYKALETEGVAIINLISAFEGEKSNFVAAEYTTFSQVFPRVWLYKVNPEIDPREAQNVILVAFKSEKEPDVGVIGEDRKMLGDRWGNGVEEKRKLVLTDDWAPVERMTEKL